MDEIFNKSIYRITTKPKKITNVFMRVIRKEPYLLFWHRDKTQGIIKNEINGNFYKLNEFEKKFGNKYIYDDYDVYEREGLTIFLISGERINLYAPESELSDLLDKLKSKKEMWVDITKYNL